MVNGFLLVVLQYVRTNLRSFIISGLVSLTGTGISTYGWFQDIQFLVYLGPVVATLGKLMLTVVIFYPVIKSRLSWFYSKYIETLFHGDEIPIQE